MRIRMLTTVAEPGRTLEANEEYELDDAEARDLCSRPDDMPRAEPVAVKQAQRRETRKARQ
jgi:hypothetical protein